MESLGTAARGFGYLFYLVNPFETMFQSPEDVPKPDYVAKVRMLLSMGAHTYVLPEFKTVSSQIFLLYTCAPIGTILSLFPVLYFCWAPLDKLPTDRSTTL